ncbi:HAD family hydrolase [Mycoplasma sp. AC157]|uniref:HAD family hydrolase n=1 Tax=Mycoplasma sp. 480 TaxID=3440155 RepID=UPI003F5159F3
MDKISKLKIENIFFDLDGTLLNSQKKITNKSIEIIEKLRQNKGIKASIITGRPYYFAKEEYYKINSDFPIVSCNGSLIYDFKKDKVIFENPINKEKTKEIFGILIKNNITFLIYTTKKIFGFYSKKEFPEWFNWLKNTVDSKEEKYRFDIVFSQYNNLKENYFNIQNHSIIKFLIIKSDSEPNNITNFKKEIEKVTNIYLINSQEKVIDIMPENSSKGKALEILSKIEKIDLEKTLVFGDQDNDVSMFEVAKFSVAMGQSKEEIKEKSTFTTNSNDEEGIYNFLRNLI